MPIKIAINGFGRIGRDVCRAVFESRQSAEFDLVAINDLGDAQTNAHLFKYDTVHGRFNGDVSVAGDTLNICGDSIKVFALADPAQLPWAQLGVDIVLECSGRFNSKQKASAHIQAGAKKVVISAPAGNQVDATIVYGVNHHVLSATDTIISNASCTTNCLAPLVKPLDDKIGLVSGLMTTIHSFTNGQKLIDGYHKDLRRARAATQNMIPTKTGAATAVGLVLPNLNGKLDGFSIRVPTINVSLVDLTFRSVNETSVDEVDQIMRQASMNELKGILGYNDLPLVSSDFNHNPHSAVYDASMTRVIEGSLIKVCAWYDNEWGFSNRMLDTTKALMAAG